MSIMKISRAQLRRIVREAVEDEEGTPVGSALGGVAKTSETKLANNVGDALGEDDRFNTALSKLIAAARGAVMRSELTADVAADLTDDDFEQELSFEITHAVTTAIVGAIKGARSSRE